MFINRDIFDDLQSHLDKKEITLIVGPRQAGKTTLMKMLQQKLQKEGKMNIFMSLDFEKDTVHFVSQQALINKLQLEFGNTFGYVFIDEIQRKENAGLFLKGIYDMELPYKFIVSGSGSLELKEKIHESLVGRKKIFELSTISIREFLHYKTQYRYADIKKFCMTHLQEAHQLLMEYINFGGYPRVILENTLRQKIDIINDIYSSYIEKDITYLLRIEKTESFKNLIKILSSQVGRLISFSELSSTLGVSIQTVKNYIMYAEKTCIITLITPFFTNVRKEITKSPVVYFNDIGLLNYISGKFGEISQIYEHGFLFQNVIFLLLKNRYSEGNISIHYWRTKDKAEVDFIIRKGLDVLPVEVKCTNCTDYSIGRSLHSFIEKYKPREALIVNLSAKSQKEINGTTVTWIPWYELLV